MMKQTVQKKQHCDAVSAIIGAQQAGAALVKVICTLAKMRTGLTMMDLVEDCQYRRRPDLPVLARRHHVDPIGHRRENRQRPNSDNVHYWLGRVKGTAGRDNFVIEVNVPKIEEALEDVDVGLLETVVVAVLRV